MLPDKRKKSPVIVIVGPTAVGKTELSIQLAKKLNGEIISADSKLFYRGMDIGTAKPSKDEMLNVKHHLIDTANPDETWSLALYQQKAVEIIEQLHSINKLPIIVGGTGQYIRAVTEGWTPPEVQADPRLRIVLEELSRQYSAVWLHDKLRILDPVSAGRIDLRNIRRTIRALEVILSTGRPFSEQRGMIESPYNILMIGLCRPRIELYKRIDDRIEIMFELGLLNEVRNLLDSGYSADLPCMSAIGYRECIQVLNNSLSIEDAKIQMRRLTRVFVRRQANWFKADDQRINWFEMHPDPLQRIEKFITQQIINFS